MRVFVEKGRACLKKKRPLPLMPDTVDRVGGNKKGCEITQKRKVPRIAPLTLVAGK